MVLAEVSLEKENSSSVAVDRELVLLLVVVVGLLVISVGD